MPDPLAVLDEEHVLIERLLSVLELEVARIDAGAAPDLALVQDAIRFFAEYADARHHGKEEQCLFPMLAAKKQVIRDGPIKVLTGEHDSGRYFTRELREGLNQLERGDGAAVPRIRRALFLYAQMLRRHIAKEREIVFLLARVLLTEEEMTELANQFQATDQERTGAPVSDYLALVERLEKRSQTP